MVLGSMLEPQPQDVLPSTRGYSEFHLGRQGHSHSGQGKMGNPGAPSRSGWLRSHRPQIAIGSITRQIDGEGPCARRRTLEGADQAQCRPDQATSPWQRPNQSRPQLAPRRAQAQRLQASMWKSIVGAWLNVRSRLTKSDPSTGEEILRQPIFGNPSILNANGDPLGVSGRGEGSTLAHSGCTRVKHL